MRPVLLGLLALHLLALPLLAQDPPQPPKFPVRSPELSVVRVESAAAKLPYNRLLLLDADVPFFVMTFPSGFVTSAVESGPAKIFGWFADGSKPEWKTVSSKFVCVVQATGDAQINLAIILVGAKGPNDTKTIVLDVGNGPGPAPGPGPGPTPPNPSDPLFVALQAAYAADAAPDKANQVQKLAALYRTAAGTTVQDASLTTVESLLKEMQAAVKLIGLPPGSLAGEARAIANELNKVLPTNPSAPLDAATRGTIANTFVRVANALGGLK